MSPYNSITFCFTNFGALLLGTDMFRIDMFRILFHWEPDFHLVSFPAARRNMCVESLLVMNSLSFGMPKNIFIFIFKKALLFLKDSLAG